MREPMVRRGRLTRQQRLLRTGIGVVVVVAVAALIANALGGGDSPGPGPDTPQVSFVASARSTSNAGKAKQADVDREVADIKKMLDGWYQRAFVDPEEFGDGTFPQVAELFAKDAKTSFTRDIASLTIGDARTVVSRVEPTRSQATITVYFDKGTKPTFAVAVVRFNATATQKQKAEPKIDIDQRATFHLEKIDGKWRVTYYKTALSEEPIQPTPTATAS